MINTLKPLLHVNNTADTSDAYNTEYNTGIPTLLNQILRGKNLIEHKAPLDISHLFQ